MAALTLPQASALMFPLIPANEELDFQNQHIRNCDLILKRIAPEILGQIIVEFCEENRESIRANQHELNNEEISLVIEGILVFLSSSNPTYYDLNRAKIDKLQGPYSPEKLDLLIDLIRNSFKSESNIFLREDNTYNTKEGVYHSVLQISPRIYLKDRVLTTEEKEKITGIGDKKVLFVARQAFKDAMRYQLLLRREKGPQNLSGIDLREKPKDCKKKVTIVEKPTSLKRKEGDDLN